MRGLIEPVEREVAQCLRRLHGARTLEADPSDLVQEILLKLLEHDARELRRWDPRRGRTLASFVRLIARRRIARVFRRGHGRLRSRAAFEIGARVDPGPAAATESRRLLAHVVEGLAPRMRDRDHALFDLIFVEELDSTAVAARLGMSRPAVNAWTYRIRKSARRILNAS